MELAPNQVLMDPSALDKRFEAQDKVLDDLFVIQKQSRRLQ